MAPDLDPTMMVVLMAQLMSLGSSLLKCRDLG